MVIHRMEEEESDFSVSNVCATNIQPLLSLTGHMKMIPETQNSNTSVQHGFIRTSVGGLVLTGLSLEKLLSWSVSWSTRWEAGVQTSS